MEPKFCNECKWSNPDKDSAWSLRCFNRYVIAKDSWALSNASSNGTNCHTEREGIFFNVCGMSGKKWEAK